MTTALENKTCTPCHGGVPPLRLEEPEALRENAKDWELLDDAPIGHRRSPRRSMGLNTATETEPDWMSDDVRREAVTSVRDGFHRQP